MLFENFCDAGFTGTTDAVENAPVRSDERNEMDETKTCVDEIGRKRLPVGRVEGPEMSCVHVGKFGDLYAPEKLSDLVGLLEAYAEAGHDVVAWRGQEDICWSIDCTATRRLETRQPDIAGPTEIEESVTEYEERLLAEARLIGHGFRNGRELSDLELLSVLRHYGAATRLMDFTRNAFIALWFATRSRSGSYGLLIGADPRPGASRRVRTKEHLEKPLRSVMDRKNIQRKFLLWEPRHLFDRMRVQQSLFVLGPVARRSWGSAPFGLRAEDPEQVPEELVLVAVSPWLKQQLLDIDGYKASWRSLFGYEERYMFPDLEGYAGSHGSSAPFHQGFFAEPRYEGEPLGSWDAPDT